MADLKFLDLFCGCGGITKGLLENNFELIAGIDNEEQIVKTYNQNFKNKGLCKDITNYSPKELTKDLNINKNDIDLIVGGPPCQGFSIANMWDKVKNDPRNALFYNFVDYVSFFKPKLFLMENVKGILSLKKGEVINAIVKSFTDIGYFVNEPTILNSMYFGVPQKRERVFIIGTIKSTPFDWPINGNTIVTVSEAISDLYKYEAKVDESPVVYNSNASCGYQRLMRKKSDKIHNHEPRMPALSTQEKIAHVSQGGNWQQIPEKYFPNNRKNRHSSAFKRLHENEPSITIDTGNAHSNYFHPLYNRIPTVREAARIQSFPDNFIFKGSRTQQYRQVGNAVPPLLAFELSKSIEKAILSKK